MASRSPGHAVVATLVVLSTLVVEAHSWAAGRALLPWASKAGAYINPAIAVSEAQPRGLVATRDVEEGEVLVVLPPELQLGVDELMESDAPSDQPLKEMLGATQAWSARLGIALVRERALGDQSRFRGYVDALPSPGEDHGLVLTATHGGWAGPPGATTAAAAGSAALRFWPPTAGRVSGMRKAMQQVHGGRKAVAFDELCWGTSMVS